jgi:hypothetical protein
MNQVEQILSDAAATNTVADLRSLDRGGRLREQIKAVAAGPMAPLLATALRHALEADPHRATIEYLEAFASALSEQDSYLALRESTDQIFAVSPPAATVIRAVHNALISPHADNQTPSMRILRLEVALRAAITGAVPRYSVLAELTMPPPQDVDEYASGLAKLIGVALDLLAAAGDRADLIAALSKLKDLGSADAAFEMAMVELREALTAEDEESAQSTIRRAREMFQAASQLEESRDDASAYAVACSAVIAFIESDPSMLRAAAESARKTATTRALLMHRMHQRTWLLPRRTAEIAWLVLAWRLEAAADELAAEEFLSTWEAIDALLAVYRHDRARSPFGLDTGNLVRPAVENRLAQRVSMMRQLQRAVDSDMLRPEPQLPPEAAELLRAAKRARPRSSRSARRPKSPADPKEPANLPYLDTLLGGDLDILLEGSKIDAKKLERLELAAESLTWNGIADRPDLVHPVLESLENTLLAALGENPAFTTSAGGNFALLVSVTLRFLLMAADAPAPYMRPLKPNESIPLEAELQRDYSTFLRGSPLSGRIGVELRDVAGGRADVYVTFDGAQRFVIEIKRELDDNSRVGIEAAYLAQAIEYQVTNVPLSMLLVLDLTDHSHGIRHLSDAAWVVHRNNTEGKTRRSAVIAVVAGNRPFPSSMK